jgi:hypothetical protein
MMRINLILVVIFVIYIEENRVLTLNIKLSNLEENLLYSYLKNETNLKLFYEKLIQSNGVDNSIHIRQNITDQDIQQGFIQNKVKYF